VEADGFGEVFVAEDVEDGGEGFLADEVGLLRELDEGGADVEGFGRARGGDAFAAGDVCAFGAGLREGLLHGVEGLGVDEGAYEGFGVAGVADGDGGVDAAEFGEELVVDARVDEEAAEGGAALAGSAHGAKGDGAEGEVQVGGGADDAGVVAAELEEGSGEAGGEAGADEAAHAGGAGGGDEGDEGRVDEGLAGGVVAEEEGGEVGEDFGWEVSGVPAGEVVRGAEEEGLGGEGGEGGLFRGLPDDGVAADEGEGGVPAPDGDGEVEGGDDAGDAEGVPLLHHAVVGALGGDGDAADGAGKAGGVGADVDHLLNLAAAFGEDLAGLDGDEAAEGIEVGAELFAEEADEFAAAGHGDLPPMEEGGVGAGDGGCGVWGEGDVGEEFAGDGGVGGEGAVGEGGFGDAEVEQEGVGFGAEGGGRGCGVWGVRGDLGGHGRYRAFRGVSRWWRTAPPSLPRLRGLCGQAEKEGSEQRRRQRTRERAAVILLARVWVGGGDSVH